MEDKESSCEDEYEYYTDTENEADREDNGKQTYLDSFLVFIF